MVQGAAPTPQLSFRLCRLFQLATQAVVATASTPSHHHERALVVAIDAQRALGTRTPQITVQRETQWSHIASAGCAPRWHFVCNVRPFFLCSTGQCALVTWDLRCHVTWISVLRGTQQCRTHVLQSRTKPAAMQDKAFPLRVMSFLCVGTVLVFIKTLSAVAILSRPSLTKHAQAPVLSICP
jgi:hypothetical protein